VASFILSPLVRPGHARTPENQMVGLSKVGSI
jgi:hypothetical protein